LAKGKLFEYAVLYHPAKTKEQLELGEEPRTVVITKPITLIATSEKEVAMIASKGIPESYSDKMDNVEIVVRTF
jgi:hypothetical protein